MSAASHTPGPWLAMHTAAHGIHCNIAGTGGRIGGTTEAGLIAHVKCIPDAWGSAESNARLIAAAPQLVEALKALLSATTNDGRHCRTLPVVVAAEAALAAAGAKP